MTDVVPVPPVQAAPLDGAATAGLARYQAQVRWSDPDQMGHINHARYLSYFEDARMDLLARSPSGVARGGGTAVAGSVDSDLGYIAARVAVDYLHPVEFRPGLRLLVTTWVSHIGTTSWTLLAELHDDERELLVARCEAVMVAYSYRDRVKRKLTDDERAFWQARLVR